MQEEFVDDVGDRLRGHLGLVPAPVVRPVEGPAGAKYRQRGDAHVHLAEYSLFDTRYEDVFHISLEGLTALLRLGPERLRKRSVVVEIDTNVTGFGDAEVELIKAAQKGKDWWINFTTAVPEWFELYLGLEYGAARISSYDTIIPGLLQTREYAEALFRAGERRFTDEEIHAKVELRMARQKILTRDEGAPQLWLVLDLAAPAVHRRPVDVDDCKVRVDQLADRRVGSRRALLIDPIQQAGKGLLSGLLDVRRAGRDRFGHVVRALGHRVSTAVYPDPQRPAT